MRDEILRMLLTNAGGYHSGEEISQKLGITRAAVWKHIHALENEGVEIEARTRKGYRLISTDTLPLCSALLEPLLTTHAIGREAVFLNSAPSSNLIARQLAHEGLKHGAVVVVEEQTAGRGRRGRGWVNAPGQDICLSVVLRPALDTELAPRFTLAAALGVYRLAQGFGLFPSIKWPNDVLLNGKKLCGILLELSGTVEALDFIVTGFGVNVNTPSFPDELREHATSLRLETGARIDRAAVLATLLNILEPLFDACADGDAFAGLLADYKAACGTLGQEITVTGTQLALSGIAEDIDPIGRLLLRDAEGKLHTLAAGDVTLRG